MYDSYDYMKLCAMFKDPGGGRRRASEGKLTEEYEPSAPKISRMVPALRSPRNSW